MKNLEENYDIVVVGAGHAGCEAALACARLGFKTIVFTVSVDSIALMPCNPNIGGSSKGHLVREVDALGGEMGKVIDRTFIQSKMLNRGPLSAGSGGQEPLQRGYAPGTGGSGEPGDQAGGSGENPDGRRSGYRCADLLRHGDPLPGRDPVYRHLSPGPVRLRRCKHEHRTKRASGGEPSDGFSEGAWDRDVPV